MTNQLFFLSLADIFSVYPSIFKEVIACRVNPSLICLPSDGDWQEKVYYRLLEVQKRVNEALEGGANVEESSAQKERAIFDPLDNVKRLSPSISPTGLRFENRKKCSVLRFKVACNTDTCWSLENIAKAAKLLAKPPRPVDFENEHEMRNVYSLIYDVFRYKLVLSNALDDICFYDSFPEYKKDDTRIWLMLFELYGRRFKQRYAEEIDSQTRLYRDSDVADIAQSLWSFRKCLAASISRMRIKCRALTLSQILPLHLQNEKVAVAASNPVVTGWINPFRLRDKNAADKYLLKMGFVNEPAESTHELIVNHYRWDNVCPLFISCIPADRGEFTKSSLMTDNFFIMQDKAFSYGPAIMSRLLDYFELNGDILQTHISSPRSTAYLAALFYSVNRVNSFYVYGAGTNLKEYRKYMENLGITNIRLFAESFISFGLESRRFGTVVGIFANPPNSFSAISDPIDLICSRGGDLSMLKVLTEAEISDDGKHRVSLILEEQLLTLQMAMSRPQIQFILYQTHSLVHAENQDMIQYAINLVNRTSLRKHQLAFKEKKRLEALAEAEAANIPSAATNVGSPRKRNTAQTGETPLPKNESSTEPTVGAAAGAPEEGVVLPDIDEFVVDAVPDICINQDDCLKRLSVGCFLSLIKRKQITQHNAKYLIKMAEARGLFGKADKSKNAKGRITKAQETNAEILAQVHFQNQTRKSNNTNVEQVITRLMTATNASFVRTNLSRASLQSKPLAFNFKNRECVRYRLTKLKKNVKVAIYENLLETFEYILARHIRSAIQSTLKGLLHFRDLSSLTRCKDAVASCVQMFRTRNNFKLATELERDKKQFYFKSKIPTLAYLSTPISTSCQRNKMVSGQNGLTPELHIHQQHKKCRRDQTKK